MRNAVGFCCVDDVPHVARAMAGGLLLVDYGAHSSDLSIDFIFKCSGGQKDPPFFCLEVRFLCLSHFGDKIEEFLCVHGFCGFVFRSWAALCDS